MDEVSDGDYIPVRHEMPLSTMLHCSAIFASKKKDWGGSSQGLSSVLKIALSSSCAWLIFRRRDAAVLALE